MTLKLLCNMISAAIILTLTLPAPTATGAPFQPNLVKNGNFTYWVGSDPLMWTVCGPTVEKSPDHYLTPPYSVKLSLSGCIVQLVHNITGGSRYVLSYWHLTPEYPVTLRVTIRWYNAQGGEITSSTFSNPPVKTWKQETVQLESPPEAVSMDIKFQITGSQANEAVCIDNVELRAFQPQTPTPTPTQSPTPTAAPPSGEISSVECPAKMTMGQEYTVVVHVANMGGETATFRILIQATGLKIDPPYQAANIPPGATSTFTFTVKPEEQGLISLKVNLYIQSNLIDTETLAINVSAQTPAQTPTPTAPPSTTPTPTQPAENGLEVSSYNIQVTPSKIEEGQTITAIFTLQNNGQQAHTYQVDTAGQTQTATIQPGQFRSLTFQITARKGQTITWTIKVDGQTLGQGTLSGYTITEPSPTNLTIILALAILLIIAILTGIALRKRKI